LKKHAALKELGKIETILLLVLIEKCAALFLMAPLVKLG
jgi:hypothetical protein